MRAIYLLNTMPGDDLGPLLLPWVNLSASKDN